MSGRKSRDKGARGERELARELSRLFGIEAHRGRQYHGGSDSPDVKAEIPGIHIECKRCESFSPYKAIEQAVAEAGEGQVPVVFHRRSRKPWLAVVRLDDLGPLVVNLYLVMAETA